MIAEHVIEVLAHNGRHIALVRTADGVQLRDGGRCLGNAYSSLDYARLAAAAVVRPLDELVEGSRAWTDAALQRSWASQRREAAAARQAALTTDPDTEE